MPSIRGKPNWGAGEGRVDFVPLLICAGAQQDMSDPMLVADQQPKEDPSCPLSDPAKAGSVEVCRILIGADVDERVLCKPDGDSRRRFPKPT